MTEPVTRFRELVARQLGLAFADDKLPSLREVLERRAHATRQPPAAYVERIAAADPAELGALAEELTVGETYFFRNPDQFAAFAEVVVPARAEARGRALRLLSAGCASGEEPYSLAITARTALPDPRWRIAIRGIDINPAAIRRATAARYAAWSLRETPADVQRTWFRPDGRELVLDDRIRDAVTLSVANLTVDDPELWQPDAYDAIFCRNVLMYFERATAERVVARLERALAPGGYLFLGHAETLRGLSHGFHLCHTHGTFYYQRREGAAAPRVATSVDAPPAPPRAPQDGDWVDVVRASAARVRELAAGTAATTALPAATPVPLEAQVGELLQRERFDEALALLDATEPEHEARDARLLRSVILTHVGRFAEAEAECRRLLARDELDAGAHYVMALCRDGAGDPAGAQEHDQTASYLDPLFAMPRLHLGLLARRAGDRELARRELGQAIVLFLREDDARLRLFGGGFRREALIALCRAELAAAEGGGA